METAQLVLQIHMLGEFSLACGDRRVDDQSSRSKKVWTLIQFLIANRMKDISQNDLIEVLWPDADEIGDPANTLKTIAHRARQTLDSLAFAPGKNIILYRNGTYVWNNSLPISVDAENFIASCDAAEAVGGEERLAHLMQALAHYCGDFLPKSAFEEWVMPLSSYYRTRYLHAVHSAIELLARVGRYDDIISLCRRASVIDPYDEAIHLALIQALVSIGAQQEAMSHYNFVTEMFFSHFGVTPSEELTRLYREIVRTSKSTEMDIGVIREGLSESVRNAGAFYCEYELFKDVYRIQARNLGRNGQTVHLALISVLDGYGKKLTLAKRNAAMERLRDVIAKSLRQGDVFTRYSVSQYIIMLPLASFENAEMIMNRVARNFKRTYPKMELLLHYSALPLDPVF